MIVSILRNNNKGITLIELLGALVIITIVLTGFFTMFTQSAKFQNVNESKIVAINLAKLALNDVKELNRHNISDGSYGHNGQALPVNIQSTYEDGIFKTNDQFALKLIIETEPNTNLKKATIEIYKNDGEFMTKTYTFIEVET